MPASIPHGYRMVQRQIIHPLNSNINGFSINNNQHNFTPINPYETGKINHFQQPFDNLPIPKPEILRQNFISP